MAIINFIPKVDKYMRKKLQLNWFTFRNQKCISTNLSEPAIYKNNMMTKVSSFS